LTNKILKSEDKNSNSQDRTHVKDPIKEIEKPVETIIRPQKYDKKIIKVISDEKPDQNNEQDKKTDRHENNIKTKPAEFPKQEKIQSEKQHSAVIIEQNGKSVNNESYPDKGNNILPDNEIIQDNKLANNAAEGQYVDGTRIIRHDISEDKYFDFKEIMKINFKRTALPDDKRLSHGLATNKQNILTENESKNITPKLNKTEEMTQSPFGKFLKDSKNYKNDKKVIRQSNNEKVSQVLDIFKFSSSSNEYVKERAGKQIVLKLDNK
jgi:hypothetical protein